MTDESQTPDGTNADPASPGPGSEPMKPVDPEHAAGSDATADTEPTTKAEQTAEPEQPAPDGQSVEPKRPAGDEDSAEPKQPVTDEGSAERKQPAGGEGSAEAERDAEAAAVAAEGDTPTPKPRSWSQRWIVPVAIVILVLAAFAVGAVVNAQRNATPEPVLGAESEPAAAAADGQGEASTPPQDITDGGEQQQLDEQTAQVCDRIVAFQQDISDGGVEPLDAFNELSVIEREARGTRLSSQVNNAGATVQQAIFGQATIDDVYAAVRDLATTCTE